MLDFVMLGMYESIFGRMRLKSRPRQDRTGWLWEGQDSSPGKTILQMPDRCDRAACSPLLYDGIISQLTYHTSCQVSNKTMKRSGQ
jgi:hypothetical protein